MWCLSVCCGLDRESHVNRARIQVMAFFFFLSWDWKDPAEFPESNITREQFSHSYSMTVTSDMWSLLFRKNLTPNYQGGKSQEGLRQQRRLSLGMEMHGARSPLKWRKTAACWGLETHSNYFQTAWASQHPRSIFHLPLVSQVIVAKEKSKPNISNLSGLKNPSAVWEDEGMVTVHRTGFAQLYETLFLKDLNSARFLLNSRFLAPVFLGCPKKSRVQIHRGTSYSTLLAKTRGLSVGIGLVWVPFPPHVIWEDSWEAPSGPLIQLPLWDFHSLSFFPGCSCSPCRARPGVVSGESPSTLLDRGCLTWLITLSKWLASCFSTEVLTGGVGAGLCEWGGETWPSGEAVVEAVLITLATPTLHNPRNSCDFPHAYTLRNWGPGRWRSVPSNSRARLHVNVTALEAYTEKATL